MIRNDSETVSFDTLRVRAEKARARLFENCSQIHDLLPKSRELGESARRHRSQLQVERMKHWILMQEIRLQCRIGSDLCVVMATSRDRTAGTGSRLTIQ